MVDAREYSYSDLIYMCYSDLLVKPMSYPDNDDFVLMPSRDVYPFITKFFWNWYGGQSGDAFEHIVESDDTPFDDEWVITGVEDEGIIVRFLPQEGTHLSYAFLIMEIHTKGGIVLKRPLDILDYLLPEYNALLDEERIRRYSHDILYA